MKIPLWEQHYGYTGKVVITPSSMVRDSPPLGISPPRTPNLNATCRSKPVQSRPGTFPCEWLCDAGCRTLSLLSVRSSPPWAVRYTTATSSVDASGGRLQYRPEHHATARP